MAAPTVQIIDGDGVFHEEDLKEFVSSTGVVDSRANYQVVAIMGPQSSGKSTLMNHLVSAPGTRSDQSYHSTCGVRCAAACAVSMHAVHLWALLMLHAHAFGLNCTAGMS